jgi:hypothetical protein
MKQDVLIFNPYKSSEDIGTYFKSESFLPNYLYSLVPHVKLS